MSVPMGRIVYVPDAEHHCRPGVTEYEIPAGRLYPGSPPTVGLSPPGPQHHRDGTIVECECGRTWVAYHANPRSGFLGTLYRPESRWARWRRQRQAQ